ncbi:helicase-related protein [Arhodomonas sp. SL1]|uniref:helicase-related protein n=1 Tax=Arhodomonas sp. SL1 TaxID=3425691 RepID=UPI003F881C63
MNRPDVEAILAPLKPFQRRTVEHAFHRLFQAEDRTNRFLVADEVGLGKTLVARGVIARAIDHLWESTERIDVIYVCSNQSIARSNLPKLQVTGRSERSLALATRLTMLATELAPGGGTAGLADARVNFISFTPGTSFNMGHAGGRANERQVLYWLLRDLVVSSTGLMNLLQVGVGRERWRAEIARPVPLEPGIRQRFQARVRSDGGLLASLNAAIAAWFSRVRDAYPAAARRERDRLIGELRRVLAEVCVEALEPDLVILDEFQRFKDLMNRDDPDADPASQLAEALFEARNEHGHPVCTLLLSATPYKLYTADVEVGEEDHYQDFFATVDFLFGRDPQRMRQPASRLADFRQELRRAAAGQTENVLAAKDAVEASLRQVMARTERVAASDQGDGMVDDPPLALDVRPEDVRQYLAAHAWFTAAGGEDPLLFWKSGPYLPHFTPHYKISEHVQETREQDPARLVRVLDAYADAFLDRDALLRWARIDPGHGKLRAILADRLDGGMWRLLWMPPTVAYWPLQGPFAGQERRTKTLLFSAWNFVPDVVSAVASYEAERRMIGDALTGYQEPDKQRPPLLRLSDQGGTTRARHRLLMLLAPSLVLADEFHPLTAPDGVDPRDWVREQVRERLAALDPGAGAADEPEDPRWEYMALVALEPGLRGFLAYWAQASVEETGQPNPEALPHYLNDLAALDIAELGRQPKDLAETVTDFALGAPGVLAARTLAMARLEDHERRARATQIAHSLWNLFNRPAVISLLGQLYGQGSAAEERTYWRRVLRYCIDGNLQAVLDEYWHLLWEQHRWSEDDAGRKVASRCVRDMKSAIEPRQSRVHAHFLERDGSGGLAADTLRVRTVFAQRFGAVRTEEGVVSQDAVRADFNSPFRPFVLTSTSVGQEGLDFHPWCHRLIHWNLPGNPVDLEQREGRIHRYKGHAVRRNIAQRFAGMARQEWTPGDDLWARMFRLADEAARAEGRSDLVPFWVAPGPFKVECCSPTLPYTREVALLRQLRRQRATYRIVFGQPRQEELLEMLDRAGLSEEVLSRWMIRLTP